jgi:hypothetical protein
MKNSFKLFAAALAFVGFANVASAQNSASATGTAVARIIEPISISATDGSLRFGNIISDADGGSVSITAWGGWENPSNNPTTTYNGLSALTGWWNGVYGVAGGTNNVQTGNFTVTGEPGFHYLITIPSSVTMTAGDGSTMNCTLDNPYHDVLDESVLNNVGTAYFGVGGTLYVDADQMNGTYSAEFTCTVNYE